MPVPFPGAFDSAQEMANAQLQALIRSARRGNRRETRAGQRFIRSLAHSFADELAAISGGIGNTYNMMERESAATNSALSSFLMGQGQTQMEDLGSQLAFAGPDAVNAYAGGAGRQGEALARTAAAMGTQQTQRLVGEEASERAFGESLPGVAALTGIQSARQYTGQQSRALQSQIDQINSQAPGLTAELYNAFASQLLQQQQMAQNERFHEDEMAAQERARRAAEAGEASGKARERFDRISQQAFAHMSTLLPQSGQIQPQGERAPNYEARALAGMRDYWRHHYPGKSDEWINLQARQTMESFGMIDPTRMGGLLGEARPEGRLDNPNFRFQYDQGALQAARQEGMPHGPKPTPDSIWYDTQTQLAQQAGTRYGTSMVNWEGPGFYRVSNGRLYRVG